MNIYFLYQSIKINQQNKVILTHEKYIPYLKGLVDEVRQRQHDFKNHFNVLYGLTEIEDSDTSRNELKNYLETIVERIRPVDQLLNIHDTILTAIVYSKKNLAEEKNILFNAMIKNCVPEYPLKKYELVEVVGNLLDNAIEAVENNDGIKKEVNLILGAENGVPIIQVENTKDISCVIEPDKIFEKGFSTKEGKNRGYGLYNIKQLIHYYNGTIELSFSDQLTIFKILF
jgi:two-component system sensor histidine kinase AgrC